ncbi:ABC transporter ATP-binding protein [Pontibacter sp. MBLB2868]|uniref:ABC transporter ATP-binding protein n=1 Tax=Pontibacter sp. MBLB2868 TaxID=3451555 RepID=UPI003F7564E6
MPVPTPILQIKDLETVFSAKHGFVKAVDKVSLEVFAGETVAIVGESGSGKSVTALSLMRLINTSAGVKTGGEVIFQSALLGQVDLMTLPEKQMRSIRGNEISMIFQEPASSLNPVFSCGKQVMEVLLTHKHFSKKEAKEHVLRLFEMTKLRKPEKIFDAYPHELSGGQKQRVMIAMAMACKPGLLIADEPTTALDVTVQSQILQLLNELRSQHNTALLFITHDLGVVAEIADRVLVMYKGQIVEQGKATEIFSNPKHPYTKGLLACRPTLSTKAHSLLPTISDFMMEDEFGNVHEKEYHAPEPTPADAGITHTAPVPDNKQQEQDVWQKAPLLQVENLKVYFPVRKAFWRRHADYVRAVDDVSFQVQPGETVALVGESGCGKTTLGRALLRLLDATAGRIIFNGHNMSQLSPEVLRISRRDIQMIFQDPYGSLNPMHTVGEAIMEPMRVHKLYSNKQKCLAKAMELLEKVGLMREHFEYYPHTMSGGQLQRVCIARALALQPKLIICDEPVSALDVSVQAQVLNLLNKLKREFQITYIFITHNLSVAKHMADRVLVMNHGMIVESGVAAQIFEHPQQEYTKSLIRAISKIVPQVV